MHRRRVHDRNHVLALHAAVAQLGDRGVCVQLAGAACTQDPSRLVQQASATLSSDLVLVGVHQSVQPLTIDHSLFDQQ
jgi:hypothetical protein